MHTTPGDGGPAFPCSSDARPRGNAGMSLRDYFAAKAMQAIYAGPGAHDVASRDGRYDETNWGEVVALNAYEMADAMLRARTAQSPADVQRAHLETWGKP